MHLKGLDPDEKQTFKQADVVQRISLVPFFSGKVTRLSFISEPGLYKLIALSRRPEAKAFDRWVRHEVLPAIRQTGGYLLNEGMREPVDRQAP